MSEMSVMRVHERLDCKCTKVQQNVASNQGTRGQNGQKQSLITGLLRYCSGFPTRGFSAFSLIPGILLKMEINHGFAKSAYGEGGIKQRKVVKSSRFRKTVKKC